MGQLSIQGSPLKGDLFKVNSDVNTQKVQQAAQKDGMDQLFFESQGQRYVLQAEKLDLSDLKTGPAMGRLTLPDGKVVEADITAYDDEKTSFVEAAWKGTKGTVVAALVVGAIGGFFGGAEGAVAGAGLTALIGGIGTVSSSISAIKSQPSPVLTAPYLQAAN